VDGIGIASIGLDGVMVGGDFSDGSAEAAAHHAASAPAATAASALTLTALSAAGALRWGRGLAGGWSGGCILSRGSGSERDAEDDCG
jgi:hypothetical protein